MGVVTKSRPSNPQLRTGVSPEGLVTKQSRGRYIRYVLKFIVRSGPKVRSSYGER